jgi:hypothetical protein
MEYFVLQPYKDWLLINRGEIRLEVGDKIKVLSSTGEHSYNDTTGQVSINSEPLFNDDVITNIHIKHYHLWIHKWFVKIEYNPNELNDKLEELSSKLAIEFAKWILNEIHNNDLADYNQLANIWQYCDKNIKVTTEELYQQFLKETNGHNSM